MTAEPTRNISGVKIQLDAAPCAVPDSECPLVQPPAMRAPYINRAPPAALASGERNGVLLSSSTAGECCVPNRVASIPPTMVPTTNQDSASNLGV